MEEFQAAPFDILRRCCEFMGVSEEFEFQGETERRNTGDFYSVHPAVAKLARNEWLRSAGIVLMDLGSHN